MTEKGFKRKLTAILSADVAGYSCLMGDDEEATVRMLTVYREVMATLIQKQNGKVLDSPGDNLLAEFVSVVDAVQCAVAVQKEITARNEKLSEKRRMHFRIGINLGDVIQEEDRIYGDGVNIAARLEGLAEPGGICISGIAYDQVKKKLNLKYQFVGKKNLKNIEEAVHVYRVLSVQGAAASKVIKAEVERMAFPLPEKPSIAVLPFTNMSGDAAQEYIGDGISENIISALSVGSGMFVIARNSTFTYKERPVKVQQVAHDKAITAGKRAISLDPNFSIGHAHLAGIMFFSGHFEEAIELMKKAMRLSPYYPAFYLNYLGRSYAFMRRHVEAIATCNQLYNRSLRGEYLSDWGLLYLAKVYAEFGRVDEARALMAQALKINPGLSLAYFKQGQPFKNAAHLQHELEILARAGLK